MKTLHAKVKVTADRTVTVRVPDDVAPGDWEVDVVFRPRDEDLEGRRAAWRELRSLPPLVSEGWPPEQRIRREELYDDEPPA
jgi:hypothetical protein